MSWSKQTTIWCDGDECQEWIRHDGTVADVEQYAVETGPWEKKSSGEHYCPKCSLDDNQEGDK